MTVNYSNHVDFLPINYIYIILCYGSMEMTIIKGWPVSRTVGVAR